MPASWLWIAYRQGDTPVTIAPDVLLRNVYSVSRLANLAFGINFKASLTNASNELAHT